jgi:single-strand DNA-binding protein
MSGSVNKVILVGNLGKDPEIRSIDTGIKVASFTLATSEIYTDKNSGEKKELTDWHDIVVWRGLADVVEKYLKKGMKVYIEGKIKKKSWQDKEGNTRYNTEIIADQLTILSPRNEGSDAVNKTKIFSSEGTPTPPTSMSNLTPEDDDVLPF